MPTLPPNILRPPDTVTVFTDDAALAMTQPQGDAPWQGEDVKLWTEPAASQMQIHLAAPRSRVRRLHLRWRESFPEEAQILGDHWERAYGDLEWRTSVPERVLPWYFLVHCAHRTHGIGVNTGAASLCWWQTDREGISLWLDVRNGGSGVRLGERRLHAATITVRLGAEGETAFEAAQTFCKALCAKPVLPAHPVYGSNNWYYAYGKSSHQEILADADILAAHAPPGDNRPYMTIDAGWQQRATSDFSWCGGPWTHGNSDFPDMPGLASAMNARGVRAGLWMRPLAAAPGVPETRLLPLSRVVDETARVPVLDPSLPENLAQITDDVRTLRRWGYELIKHDWSACDFLGRWGKDMGAQITTDGWRCADSSRTNAELIVALYRAIADGAEDALVIGCNTFGHLAAGIFAIQRTGDDTSGKDWERTRRMGVNTLAFRMAQHGVFFAVDADCVGLTSDISWAQNRQWLDLLARSGTPLFVSASPDALGSPQSSALKAAFTQASVPQPIAVPLDWLHTTCPARWQIAGQETIYDWNGPGGASPFTP